jgi:site-specific recombinase XerD
VSTPNSADTNSETPTGTTLALYDDRQQVVLHTAIELWASASTGVETRRRDEQLKNKQKIVRSFFGWVRKTPGDVEPTDVRTWCEKMRDQGLSPATVYTRVAFLSSFYSWAMSQPEVCAYLRQNPALLGRPKRVRSYQTEATKAWTDEELRALTDVVRQKAATGDLVAKRDLTLLLLYTSTGLRREEVISLRGQDVTVEEDRIILSGRVKGGRYRAREVQDPEVRAALLDYLTSSNRLRVFRTDEPLWTRHNHAEPSDDALSSHAFVRNLKLYAREAGMGHVHLHQTRHTYARIVAEETGSMVATQDALDHANISTTTAYVQRISVKRDLHSAAIARRRKGGGAAQ